MPLEKTVTATLRTEGMEDGCKGLILAVSGGPDSMAMLTYYAVHRPAYSVTVAHVHHGLRPESDEEETMVQSFCNAVGLPCHVLHAHVRQEMERGETVESAARRIRYEFFRSVAADRGATHIATAHTADDQCETVLLHLLHGAGPKGLCGIFPKRNEGDAILIRPLINCPKSDTIEYCKAMGTPFALDKTNESLQYTRNRIRHTVVPPMEQINPGLRQALCRTAAALRLQQEAMEARANAFLNDHPSVLPADQLRALPKGEQAEILRCALSRLGKTLSFEQTEQALALLEKSTGTVEFDRKYTLHLGQDRLTVRKNSPPPPPRSITALRTVLDDGRILTLTETVATSENRYQLIPRHLPLTLRTRVDGDVIKTRAGTKPLKKYLTELQIPKAERDALWILSDEHRLVWCERVGPSTHEPLSVGDAGYSVEITEESFR